MARLTIAVLLVASVYALVEDRVGTRTYARPTRAPTPFPTPVPTPPPPPTCQQPISFSPIDLALAYASGGFPLVDATTTLGECQYLIGTTAALIPEANDASVNSAPVVDGESGDTAFPFGPLVPIGTVGETSTCFARPDNSPFLVGAPGGVGAYILRDNQLRVLFQSESNGETFPYNVNSFVQSGGASFTGSHIQFVDYDRELFIDVCDATSAAGLVERFGEVIEAAYNLKGALVAPRNQNGPTTFGKHYSNTDVAGNYVLAALPTDDADWVQLSLASAHLEQTYQWGPIMGLVDNIVITGEGRASYIPGSSFVGLSAHAIDLTHGIDYAVGALTMGGFEKIVEINPQSTDYVMFAISGCNGGFSGTEAVLAARRATFGLRADGNPYVWPENIVPPRFYLGVKMLLETGEVDPANEFLARNGLRYGRNYGFAVDMRDTGPTMGMFRDAFHASSRAVNGASVVGKWVPIDWFWNGVVKNFEFDGSWDFQLPPPGQPEWMFYWNAAGYDAPGCKLSDVSPDPRAGNTAFVQGSKCGYFGIYYVSNVPNTLSSSPGFFPAEFRGEYFVYQGTRDVTDQINLGGAGQYANGLNATSNFGFMAGQVPTLRGIAGLEVIQSTDGLLFAIIQEDSGSLLGERIFLTSPLEQAVDGQDLIYYFVAMSGGSSSTRTAAGVGVPKGASSGGGRHQFSGAFDASGLLVQKNGTFVVDAHSEGTVKRAADATVNINDKAILMGLQALNLDAGIISAFRADLGGQWLAFCPDLP